jgi:hypothetical protein
MYGKIKSHAWTTLKLRVSTFSFMISLFTDEAFFHILIKFSGFVAIVSSLVMTSRPWHGWLNLKTFSN